MSKAIFVTGTGTDVGKTFVTGLIVKKLQEAGLKPGYFKAAVSGNERDAEGNLIPGDAKWVQEVSGIPQSVETMCPYVYEHAYSPHLAARIEGNPVDIEVVQKGFLQVCRDYEYVTMEGSGGIMCPISFDQGELYLEDVISKLQLNCLLVADAGLGTINSVVTTVEYLRNRNIEVKGIIFNHYHGNNIMEEDNIFMCQHLTGVKVIACVRDGDTELDIDIEELKKVYDLVSIRANEAHETTV